MNGHGQPALLYLVPCTLGMTVWQPLKPKVLTGIRISFIDVFIFRSSCVAGIAERRT